MTGPSDAVDLPPALRELGAGVGALDLRTSITGPVVSTLPVHRVLVNVGRPYRLLETLGDVRRPTPGAPGDVAVVPAGVPLAAEPLDGTPQALAALVVSLAPDVIDEVLDAAGRAPAPLVAVVGSRSPAVAQLGGLLHAGLADRTELGRLTLESLGAALAVAVVRDHTTVPTRPAPARELGREQLHAVLTLVEDDLSAPLTVADLAARAHVSVFHFSRLFRTTTGVSPHRYVVQRRLAHARDLLSGTDVPLAEVALRCGFADQSHLTRLVREHLGCTPAELRTAARGR